MYPVAWSLLFLVSTMDGFLPAGLRVATLWLTPMRYWPALAVAEWAATLGVAATTGIHSSLVTKTVGIFVPWLIYAAAVREVKRLAAHRTMEGMSYWVPFTLVAGLVGAAGNGLLLTGLQWLDHEAIGDPLDLLLTYALGDYAGVIALAPALVLAVEHLRSPAPLSAYLHRGWVFLPLLGLGITLVPAFDFPDRFDWFPVTTPLIAIGALGGRLPAVVGLFLLALAFTSFDLSPWQPEDIQRLLAISGSASLLLGARRDAMHRQRERLLATIDELRLKTQALRDVATRISSQREAETRQLGLELHDEVGQDMTALATRLRIAERMATDDAAREEFRLLQRMVTTAHEHLKSVIRHLHPIALERFGLRRALTDGPLADIARDAGVRYEHRIDTRVDQLPLHVATGLYRICQEAVTNGIRHGCGGRVAISLEVSDVPGGRMVELAVADDAGPIAIVHDASGGLGLQGIRDRAHALGARYRFDAGSGQPRHALSLVQAGSDGQAPSRRHTDTPAPGTQPGDTGALFLAAFHASPQD